MACLSSVIPVFGAPLEDRLRYASTTLFVVTQSLNKKKRYALHKWRLSGYGLNKGTIERYDHMWQVRSHISRGLTCYPAEKREKEFGLIESWI